MITHHTVTSIRKAVVQAKTHHHRVCLVPTMGNLHDGHISLVRQAKKAADEVVVSLFVNPLQFGPNEDLDSYPRTLAEDSARLIAEGVDHLFAPSVTDMYGNASGSLTGQTQVTVPGLSSILCGRTRPAHFSGVTTVVNMLFNIVQADSAVFGKKDFQQLAIIRKMVRDLHMPIDILAGAIVRETDGLAMSSRNNYLTAAERQIAPRLHQSLRAAADQLRDESASFSKIEADTWASLSEAGFKPDYLSIRNPDTLEEARQSDQKLILVAAAWLGKPRLLDNIEIYRG
jgi:pantoate--beta-alanine ligase